ncbi:MAG: hypothetical protein LBR47_01355, partial [Spirochaetaceae bacterium]|nr:hypothetical protein [Spirochaetaceae bacterium]
MKIENEPDEMLDCIYACIEVIESVQQTEQIVLDSGDEIFNEYKNHLSFSGQPGPGDAFFKWLYQSCWSFPASQWVKITKTGDSYAQFP